MVQKIKDRYKPHKDTKGNKTGDKEQIKGRWKEHFEIVNKNKHKNIPAAPVIEHNQSNTKSVKREIQAPTNQELLLFGHTEVKQ